jgi:hypothetical protein
MIYLLLSRPYTFLVSFISWFVFSKLGTSFVTPDGSFKPSLLIEALFSFRDKAF